MSIDNIKNKIGDSAKDIRLNISSIMTNFGGGLDERETYMIALSSAYATKCKFTIENIANIVSQKLSTEEVEAAKSAASIMAMNNIYYRFVHLCSDKEYGKMPAGLRMQVIGSSAGVDKKIFEAMSLAVSAINGCGMCIDSHVQQLVNAGMTKQAIQTTIKIAAVVNAVCQAVCIADMTIIA